MMRVASLLILLALTGCDNSAQPPSPTTPLADLQFGPVERLGKPLASRYAIHYALTTQDGAPVLCTTLSGNPAKFALFNLATGEPLESYEMRKGGSAWCHAVDSKGNVYVAGYLNTTLYRYSPELKKFEEIGPLFGETAALSMTVDEADNIYIGTYPNAKIIKYDCSNKQLRDLGNRLPGCQYLKSLVYFDRHLYAGGGMMADPAFIRVNTSTLEQEPLPAPPGDRLITSYYYANEVGGKLFFNVHFRKDGSAEGGHSLFIFDPAKGAWLDFEKEAYQGLVVSESVEGKVFFPAQNCIWSYTLATGETTDTGWPCQTSFRGSGVVRLPGMDGFEDPSLVNIIYTGARITLLNTRTGKTLAYPKQFEPAGIKINSMAFLGSKLVLSGYMGSEAACFDTLTDSISDTFAMGQAESIFCHNGRAYFGVYPTAEIESWDPLKPAARAANPEVLFSTKRQGQSRPFGLFVTDEKIVAGTIADYGMLDGALGIYDRSGGNVDLHVGIVPRQSICAVTVSGNHAYAGSTIWGGLGVKPEATAAKVIRYNLDTRKIEASAEPFIASASTPPGAVGGLTIGADGNLWGITYGSVFVMDPVSLKTLRSVDVEPTDWGKQPLLWRGFDILSERNGQILANPAGTLVTISPATMKVKRLLPDDLNRQVALIAVSPEGDLYFTLHDARDELLRAKQLRRETNQQKIPSKVEE